MPSWRVASRRRSAFRATRRRWPTHSRASATRLRAPVRGCHSPPGETGGARRGGHGGAPLPAALGRMNHLTRGPIVVEALLAAVQGTARGGTCVFLGTVRDDDGVTAIDYSAYDEM